MAPPQLRRGANKIVAQVDPLLDAAYGAPEAELGNQRDPLDEAIYIILSFQTDLPRFIAIWRELRSRYPSWDELERAPAREVATVLRHGGLHKQKARTIKRLLGHVRKTMGALTLDSLHGLSDMDAERLLTRMPGFSWKAARCVLLYSLNRDVLPIDSNSFRVFKRLGVLRANAVYRRKPLHDALQAIVPPARRRRFHVNLVVHGQRTCRPASPQCGRCALRAACPTGRRKLARGG